jgi:hypothetical protein
MNTQRKLVAPTADAMHDLVGGQQLRDRIDGRDNRLLEKVLVIAVVFLLLGHGLALGGEFFRGDVAKRDDPRKPPLGEGLVEHGGGQVTTPAGARQGTVIPAPQGRIRP